MTTYTYKARDETGKLLTGIMEADNQRAVSMQLSNIGLYPVYVSEAKSFKDKIFKDIAFGKAIGGIGRIKYDDLIFFTRQLQTIIKAGIPLIAGLKALEEQTTKAALKEAIKEMYEDIDSGKGFSDAMAKHRRIFPEVYISMVRAGEIGGVLDDVLGRLALMLEFQMKTKEMLKSAMRYPMMVVMSLIGAFFVLVTFVIPRFVPLFKASKLELPLPTRILLFINDMVQSYGSYIMVISGALLAGTFLYIRTDAGRLIWDRLKLKVPIIGNIILKNSMSRFANMFENMIRSGVPVIKALEIVSKTVGNRYLSLKIDEVSQKIERGKGISKPLKDTGIFPPLVIHLVSTGENTGSLEEMLNEVSTHYDREVTYSVSRLSAWIEPILTVGLSIMVLFMALAIFMPWWNMMSVLRGGG